MDPDLKRQWRIMALVWGSLIAVYVLVGAFILHIGQQG